VSTSRNRLGLAVCIAAVLGLAYASPAGAAVTIGQTAPTTPPVQCSVQTDQLQPTVTSGTSYVVPPGGVTITSWSTRAGASVGQQLEMKVFRLVSGLTYKVVGHDGPRILNPSTLNTFPTNVTVQPGDVLGLNDANASTVNNACIFSVPGDGDIGSYSNLADGQQATFLTPFNTDYRDNISAVVAFKASNADTLGKVKLNKNKGTATLAVNVPGPGTLSLTGKGVKAQRPGGATVSKAVASAGTVKLRIKAKGSKKKKLLDTGKVKVKVNVTYKPSANAGDVAGDAKTQTKRVKLIKKLG
jgi:hypothetical protein